MKHEALPYHRANLEVQLLEKAAEIVATRGLEALSLRELGRALSVSRAAPYHYFKDKAALLARVGELGFQRLGTRTAAAVDTRAPLPQQLRDGLRAYLDFALAEPNFFRLMFADVLQRGIETELASASSLQFSSNAAIQAFRGLAEGVMQMQQQGLLVAMDPLVMVNVFWAYTHGVAVLAVGRNLKHSDAESIMRTGFDALLRSFSLPQHVAATPATR